MLDIIAPDKSGIALAMPLGPDLATASVIELQRKLQLSRRIAGCHLIYDAKIGAFVTLKASDLNSIRVLSVIGKLRKTEKSKLARPSDRSTFRLKVPNVFAAGIANAEVLNQQLRVPTADPFG